MRGTGLQNEKKIKVPPAAKRKRKFPIRNQNSSLS